MKRRFAAIFAIIAVLAAGLVIAPGIPAPSAQAADARDFNAGNIISDQLFFDGGAMSASDVQSFLNGKLSACRAGYTCLKDYTQSTPNRAAVSGRCNAYVGAGNERASAIIAKVGAACGISQKVLLVMLEKEQSLVGDSWPSAQQYRAAMGYGCPDTADCDANYYGFFNQVYAAALQFKNYAGNPTRWNHIAGRVNTVRYNPNAACGSSQVFIQNQATAGLYNYTPYQPNASALANLYGSGDGCGAYGNRNFWRLFTDWFGSTTDPSNLLRTTDNATVYLVSGTNKYPVNSYEMLNALAPLGQVSFVSQSSLDRYKTAQAVGRIMRSEDGTIFFFDSGYKLPFGSCGMVADYGGSCDSTGYVQLTNAQTARFSTGPAMTSVMGTVEGGRYAIQAGKKREILDARSQAEAGLPSAFNVLSESGISYLPLGAPIVRESAYVQQRGSNSFAFLGSSQRFGIDAGTASALGLSPGQVATMSATSLNQIPLSGSPFTGVVRMPGFTMSQILVTGGRYDWQDAPGGTPLPYVPASQDFVGSFPIQGTIGQGTFIKANDNVTVHVVNNGILRAVTSWQALTYISGSSNPAIVGVPAAVIRLVKSGPAILTPNALVRTPSDATLYLIDGMSAKIPITSFGQPTEMGLGGVGYVGQSDLDSYPTAPDPLAYALSCGNARYVASEGKIHAIPAANAALFPMRFSPISDISCRVLAKGADAGSFIRTSDGSIYLLQGGQKLPVGSMARFAALGGTYGNWLNLVPAFAAQFPTGPAA